MRRIAVVGCGKAKLAHPAPARELYTSNLFRLSARYAQRFDGWYVASALHGLVRPDEQIAPYDRSLTDMRVGEREGWVARVVSGIANCERPHRDGGPVHVTLLAGGLYRELAGYLRWTTGSWYIGPFRGVFVAPDMPLDGLGIGQRLAWLKRELAGEPAS